MTLRQIIICRSVAVALGGGFQLACTLTSSTEFNKCDGVGYLEVDGRLCNHRRRNSSSSGSPRAINTSHSRSRAAILLFMAAGVIYGLMMIDLG